MKNIDFYNLVDGVFSGFEKGTRGEGSLPACVTQAGIHSILSITYDGVNIRLYCYAMDKFKMKPQDEYNWYITFYHKYTDSKDIRVTPGYEREFLENFRDEIIPIIKNLNILDKLISDYIKDSISGDIEKKLKSIRRNNTISTIL